LERLTELRQSGFIHRICATNATGRLVELDGLSITPAVPHLARALGSLFARSRIASVSQGSPHLRRRPITDLQFIDREHRSGLE
jgi:hypothetical protein